MTADEACAEAIAEFWTQFAAEPVTLRIATVVCVEFGRVAID